MLRNKIIIFLITTGNRACGRLGGFELAECKGQYDKRMQLYLAMQRTYVTNHNKLNADFEAKCGVATMPTTMGTPGSDTQTPYTVTTQTRPSSTEASKCSDLAAQVATGRADLTMIKQKLAQQEQDAAKFCKSQVANKDIYAQCMADMKTTVTQGMVEYRAANAALAKLHKDYMAKCGQVTVVTRPQPSTSAPSNKEMLVQQCKAWEQKLFKPFLVKTTDYTMKTPTQRNFCGYLNMECLMNPMAPGCQRRHRRMSPPRCKPGGKPVFNVPSTVPGWVKKPQYCNCFYCDYSGVTTPPTPIPTGGGPRTSTRARTATTSPKLTTTTDNINMCAGWKQAYGKNWCDQLKASEKQVCPECQAPVTLTTAKVVTRTTTEASTETTKASTETTQASTETTTKASTETTMKAFTETTKPSAETTTKPSTDTTRKSSEDTTLTTRVPTGPGPDRDTTAVPDTTDSSNPTSDGAVVTTRKGADASTDATPTDPTLAPVSV